MEAQGLIKKTPGNNILVVDRNTPLDAGFKKNVRVFWQSITVPLIIKLLT
jgi:hypothetical protein